MQPSVSAAPAAPALADPLALAGSGALPALVPRRSPLAAWRAALDAIATPADAAPGLDAVLLGGPGTDPDAATAEGTPAVALPRLTADAPMADGWWVQASATGTPPLQQGTCGAVAWRHCGPWLHGSLDLPDDGRDLQALAQRAYANVFATLRQAGAPHLLRLWNYLPRIHDESQGLERYRQFNAGRQQAFIDAGHSAFDGAPAACALGSHDGLLRVRFLAGPQAPLPVENPRQVSAYRYPTQYGPRAPTFSRAALAGLGGGRTALFVSGTASIVGHASQHLGDVRAQTQETLRNLHTLLQAAGTRNGLAFDLRQMAATVYIRHPADLPAVRQALAEDLGADAPLLRQALWLQADVCRRELLVEIEGHLVAEGALQPA